MDSPRLRLRYVWYLARKYGLKRLRARLRYRVQGETRSVGLRRDLLQPFERPAARAGITVRPVQDGDLAALWSESPGDDDAVEENARRYRYRMTVAGLPGCHVAVTSDDEPCHVLWLLTGRDNARVRWALGPLFPEVDDDSVLLEGAYTPVHMRGQGIMSSAMAAVAERGQALGARWALTFIDEGNVASIKGARRAGFEPYLLRIERWRWFRRTVVFEPTSQDVSDPPP
jgi:RimJ/RimL family protein N-acetyltransferase